MVISSPAQYIDHTLLKPDATTTEILRVCEEATEYGFASVCVPPRYVPLSFQALYGTGIAIGTVVGFPLGYETPEIKVLQVRQAISAGAEEIDMVIALGAAREGRFEEVRADIEQVVAAASGKIVKVIIECCLFDDVLKRQLAALVVDTGADYVKTSTGFAAHGATLEDVALIKQVVADRVKIKAAGGIRDWSTCLVMLEAGASRIGTSFGVTIMQQWQRWAGIA